VNRYPLAFGYLAGTIKKETDWGVMAYNADFNPANEFQRLGFLVGEGFESYLRNVDDLSGPVWQEVRATIAAYRPAVVGITSFSLSFKSARKVAQIAKEVDKDIVVIVGGPHASVAARDALGCRDMDIAVRGEGEVTIVELLAALERGGGLEQVKGITFRKGGEIVENPARELIEDLDALCFPNESAPGVLKDYEQYPPFAFANIFAVRGCPFDCYFCSSRKIWTRRTRFRSVGNVIQEIKLLQKRGVRRVRFDDDMFGVNKKHIRELCEALRQECPGLQWECEIHLSLVDDETVAQMKSAGCRLIQIGIESGSNEILKVMRKRYTIEQALAACRLIRKHGVKLEAFFMLGFPYDTEKTILETYEAIKKSQVDKVGYNVFTPFPGTEAYQYCKDSGLITDDHDPAQFNYHSPKNCFVKDISPERFRELRRQVEKLVQRKNQKYRLMSHLSMETVHRIAELGLAKSVVRGFRLFAGR
jgi:radical SAM superfamily enzyme YgiQ (UPF0313 family)